MDSRGGARRRRDPHFSKLGRPSEPAAPTPGLTEPAIRHLGLRRRPLSAGDASRRPTLKAKAPLPPPPKARIFASAPDDPLETFGLLGTREEILAVLLLQERLRSWRARASAPPPERAVSTPSPELRGVPELLSVIPLAREPSLPPPPPPDDEDDEPTVRRRRCS